MLLLCPTQRRAKGWLEKSAGEEFAGEEFAGEAGAERSLQRSPGAGRMLGRELHPFLFCREKIAHFVERNLLVVACRDGKALQMLDKYPTSKSPAVPGWQKLLQQGMNPEAPPMPGSVSPLGQGS